MIKYISQIRKWIKTVYIRFITKEFNKFNPLSNFIVREQKITPLIMKTDYILTDSDQDRISDVEKMEDLKRHLLNRFGQELYKNGCYLIEMESLRNYPNTSLHRKYPPRKITITVQILPPIK